MELWRLDLQPSTCGFLRVAKPDYRENIWDHAAGAILVEECGGWVSDRHGKPLDFSQGQKIPGNAGIIASCGLDHDRVMEAIVALPSVPQKPYPTQ